MSSNSATHEDEQQVEIPLYAVYAIYPDGSHVLLFGPSPDRDSVSAKYSDLASRWDEPMILLDYGTVRETDTAEYDDGETDQPGVDFIDFTPNIDYT